MMKIVIASLFLTVSNPLKIWAPSTNINNSVNWDTGDIPKDCDSIRFQAQNEIAAYWDLKNVTIGVMRLPQTGDIIFPENLVIQFRNKKECSHGRELKYIRHEVKGWLDPDNWVFSQTLYRGDNSSKIKEWVPHSERVPCAGEVIIFPPNRSFAIQLPSVLVPITFIMFDNQVFMGEYGWSLFLSTEFGFKTFKGPDDLRNEDWVYGGSWEVKPSFCGESSYIIHEGGYKKVEARIFEEAVCSYARPKCKPPGCLRSVIPEGHCCGICGDVIKLKNTDKKSPNISFIESKVKSALKDYNYEEKLKTYVGITKEKNIQIVIIAENPDHTIESHTLANIITRELTGHNIQLKISSSGLRFSNYLFNNVSGIVFGTLIAVLLLFVSIYYIYLVLPKKKFQNSRVGNPFLFARFDNIGNEENLEIGVEPESSQELPQAFDNPMYSGNTEPEKKSTNPSSSKNLQLEENESSKTPEGTVSKEYVNPIYAELEKPKKLDDFSENSQEDEDTFSEIKF